MRSETDEFTSIGRPTGGVFGRFDAYKDLDGQKVLLSALALTTLSRLITRHARN